MKKVFTLYLLSASMILAGTYPALSSDEFFEEYSKKVSDQIAEQGDSAEDFYQGQEMQEGDAVSFGGEEEETEGGQAEVDDEESDEAGMLKVSAFHGYEWGTSADDIQKAEISPDMENKLDYSLLQIDESGTASDDTGIQSLGVKGYSIGGYDATSFYVFEKGKLTEGVYEFFMDGDAYLDLVSQCSIAYGKPAASGESSDEHSQGAWSLWEDPEGNYIFAALSLGVIYAQHDSAITGVFEDGIERDCGISIEEQLQKNR